MIDDLNLDELRKAGRIGYYFRYPIHRNDFHDLRINDHIHGHYTAKPLYGHLTPEGRVDKSAGFNGNVAVLFVPLAAKTADDVKLFISHTAPKNIQLPTGKRNWRKINDVAVKFLTKHLEEKWIAGTKPVASILFLLPKEDLYNTIRLVQNWQHFYLVMWRGIRHNHCDTNPERAAGPITPVTPKWHDPFGSNTSRYGYYKPFIPWDKGSFVCSSRRGLHSLGNGVACETPTNWRMIKSMPKGFLITWLFTAQGSAPQ